MIRITSCTCKILFIILILSAAQVPAPSREKALGIMQPSISVAIKTLLKKMPRVELLKTLGPNTLSDSTIETKNGHTFLMFLFEPVTFEGVPAIIEAVMAGDSTTRFQVYLPYIGRPATRLHYPFEMANFVQATAEDYNQMERKIEDELGIPTVLTGTNFEYIDGNIQSIFGVFKNGEVKITIVPQTGS